MPSATYQLERDDYAHIYGTSVRSVGNYEREDAPLDDPAAMYAWLWGRRHRPPAFCRMTREEVVNAYLQKTAVGAARQAVIVQAIDDLLTDIDAGQNIIRCKLVIERQRHTEPAYSAALFACISRIADAVEEARRAIGTYLEEDFSDMPDDDAPPGNIVPLPMQAPTPTRAAHV